MDTQLEAPLDQPDARPFTSRYMAKSGMTLPRSKGPIIVCQSINPPHYSLAHSGDSSPGDYEEIQRVCIGIHPNPPNVLGLNYFLLFYIFRVETIYSIRFYCSYTSLKQGIMAC